MDFGAILSKTWNITWRFKALWILGILGGCSASGRGRGGGRVSSSFRGYEFDSPEFHGLEIEEWPWLEDLLQNFTEGVMVALVLGIFFIVLSLALLFLALGVIGQGGLIAGFGRADEGSEVSLGEAFNLGLQHFWRLLGIRLVFWLAGLIIGGGLFIGLVVFGILTMGVGLICLIPLICLLIPVGLAIGLAIDAYVILTMVAAVEEEAGVFDSFKLSWDTARENLGSLIVMALILIVGSWILSIFFALPFIAVAFPALLGFLAGADETIISGLVISGMCLLLLIPVVVLLNGILTTFTTGAWTLTYRRVTGKMGAELAS